MTMQPDRDPTGQPSFSEEFGNALEYGWGPILVSLLFSAALALPDPSHEALMSVAENATRSAVGAVAGLCTALAFFFLPPTLYMFTKFALETPRHFGPHNAQVERVLLTWVGRLPLLAVLVAGMQVQFGADTVSLRARLLLGALMLVCGFFALSGIWVFLSSDLRQRLAGRMQARAATREARGTQPAWPIRLLLAFYLWVRDAGTRNQTLAATVCAGLLLVLAVLPQWSVWLGPIAVTIVFVSLAAIALAVLTRLSSRLSYGRVPLILFVLALVMAGTGGPGRIAFLVLALAYGFAVFIRPGQTSRPERVTAGVILALAVGLALWGHLRRDECGALAGCYLVRPMPVDPARPDMAAAYRDWLEARRSDSPDGPVRLIAAEGGGLFSAYYTALYLAKRADTEGPDFARSVFAISGVSGGSVGAATFWAIVRSGVCDEAPPAEACHQKLAREILGQDYLTPVLARMFTTDLADRLLPFSSVRPAARQDRARQLEVALSDRTATAIAAARKTYQGADPGDGPRDLDGSLAAGWSPEAGVPALFLNTTRVWDGGRLMLSPFDRMVPDSPAAGPDGRMAGAGLAVSTAAFMSARFPVVTAAARLQSDGQIRQIVDGGYFDNSGMETVNDILEVVRPSTPDRDIQAISLTTVQRADQEGARDAIRGTLGTPLGAFLGAWRSRLTTVWERMAARWAAPADSSAPRTYVPVFKLPLNQLNYTVSWYLDRNSFCRIEQNLNARLMRAAGRMDADMLSTPQDCPPLAVQEPQDGQPG